MTHSFCCKNFDSGYNNPLSRGYRIVKAMPMAWSFDIQGCVPRSFDLNSQSHSHSCPFNTPLGLKICVPHFQILSPLKEEIIWVITQYYLLFKS